MGAVLSKDAEYSDFHLDLLLSEKRLVRVAVKTYNSTGTYLSLKLFKREKEQVDWDFNQKITLSAREFNLICHNIEKINQMIETPVGLIDSLLEPDSSEESKRSGKRSGKSLTQRAKKPKIITTVNEDSELLASSLSLIVFCAPLLSLFV